MAEVNGEVPAVHDAVPQTNGDVTDGHLTADEMDEKRKQNMAYEYLCHLEEAKKWIEACIKEELPITTELEENLQNGVILATLGNFFAPKAVPLKRIYDKDQSRYKKMGLHYRHTDNVVQFFGALEEVGLPQVFYPDTSDVYDKKNMPKLIYCIHALSLYLFKLGKAPLIQNLLGKVEFTEEEISAMRQELEKYGIQMPHFGKIGGILADQMPVDEAALHAAVIAINEALEKGDPKETIVALRNPNAHLTCVEESNADGYHQALMNAKQTKAETARNKASASDADSDVYDTLLTQAEIQGHLAAVNANAALMNIDDALSKSDANSLAQALVSPFLDIKSVNKDNKVAYLTRLREARDQAKKDQGDSAVLGKEEIQRKIHQANSEVEFEQLKIQSVDKVNGALRATNPDELYRALDDPSAKYPPVFAFAAMLYFEEFSSIREEKGSDLDYGEISGGVKVLSAIANINKAVKLGDASNTLTALTEPNAHLVAVDHHLAADYQRSLLEALREKQLSKPGLSEAECPLLTHGEIQERIDMTNEKVQAEHAKIDIINMINAALAEGSWMDTYKLLSDPSSQLADVDSKQSLHYYNLLQNAKVRKAKETGDENAELWWEDIQSVIAQGNKHAREALQVSVGIASINKLAEEDNADKLFEGLTNPDVQLKSLSEECKDLYLMKIKEAKRDKSKKGSSGSGWLPFVLRDGTAFFYNANTNEYRWEAPEDEDLDSSLLTKEEIQSLISETTANHNRELYLEANEESIVKIQAHTKGYLAQKKYKERLQYLKQQQPHVIKLQAHLKARLQRKAYLDRLKYLKENEDKAIKIQSYMRMMLARKKYQDRLKYLASQEDKVIKIQAAWRSNKTRSDYQTLMHAPNPPLNVVRKFVHLLDQSDTDYAEEIELQKQRQLVVQSIRSNQQLEKDLSSMDIKIGLLVKNRITLEEVITHEGKLSKHKDMSSYSLSGGLGSLNKESKERLDAYQHLFYQLQVNPQYLAKLIFEMPQQHSSKFIESVILTLYNYASNPREEFLLLKLFASSLQEEIRTRIETTGDIVQGNPIAIKMVVDFHRNARGHSYLRDMLHPLVNSLLEDKSVKINTNPVEVYKQWVNQTETESGVASGLPYDVTNDEALKQEEVQKRMEESIQQLRYWSDKFLNHILASLDQIPYGMRYIAKVMFEALRAKSPDAPEKEHMKIIGNLLYYRYINPTIAAPDAYGIIDIDAEKGALTADQRRNLGSIAKILQFAASNKGFGNDSQHLAVLNTYIKSSHEKFKQYFQKACQVEEPEIYFNIDQYSDYTLMTKPVITISVTELLNTHAKLLEFEDKIAPDPKDVLHELIDDAGEKVPTLQELTGEEHPNDSTVHLTLTNKFEAQVDDKADLKNLLAKTKRYAVDVIRCQPGETITEVLESPTADAQEEQHDSMIQRQEQVDARAKGKDANVITRTKSERDKDNVRLGLADKKKFVSENIVVLSQAGLLSSADNYQELVNLIRQDVRNQSKYRQMRHQDLRKLKTAMENLKKKREFFESQIDYYKMYVKACLDNLNTQKRKSHRSSYISVASNAEEDKRKSKKPEKKKVVKYSAAKLCERGIVIEIEELPANQFKNVQFEISTTDDPGVFHCDAKFMGVAMETHTLKFQDLLQLQYEGVAVMELFDRAKVNVNLLIFFLNKKFYGTKK